MSLEEELMERQRKHEQRLTEAVRNNKEALFARAIYSSLLL